MHLFEVPTLKKNNNNNKALKPGPASTVEERSLRKSSSEGTAVRSPLKEASFQARINLQYARTIIPTNLDGFFQSRNLDPKKLLPIKKFYCMKGNVAWINWSIILLRNSTTILQPVSITSSQTFNDGVREVDCYRPRLTDRRFLSCQYD